MTPDSNTFLWNSLVAATILVGACVTILVLNREHYFPALYAAHASHPGHAAAHDHKPPAEAESSPVVHEDTLAIVPEHPQQEVLKSGAYVLVCGSFLSEAYARKYQSEWKENTGEVNPDIVPVAQGETTYYRVVVFRSEDRERVLAMQKQLSLAGKETWWYKQ
jgi:hypothetical protein